MTEAEIEANLKTAKQLDEFDYIDPDEEEVSEGTYHAYLYEAKDGRVFRYVESSGMNSPFAGGGNIGDWLTPEEAKNWKELEG